MFKEHSKRLDFFIPNEIFIDFSKLNYKSNSHYAFTVCYYVLTSFLYYKAHYGIQKLTQPDLKEYLGYSRDNPTINYIIKRNGLLDQTEYTETTTDYPILYDYIRMEYVTRKDADTEIGKYIGHDRNYTVKVPLKGLYGSFVCIKNTTKIDFRIFERIVTNKDLGCTSFLVYLYIKFRGTLIIGFEDFSKIIKCSVVTLQNAVKSLESRNYISVTRGKFDLQKMRYPANSYTAKKV